MCFLEIVAFVLHSKGIYFEKDQDKQSMFVMLNRALFSKLYMKQAHKFWSSWSRITGYICGSFMFIMKLLEEVHKTFSISVRLVETYFWQFLRGDMHLWRGRVVFAKKQKYFGRIFRELPVFIGDLMCCCFFFFLFGYDCYCVCCKFY